MSIQLKLVKDHEGCEHFRELQRRVWGGSDDDMVPNHVTVTVLKNGGALLGAYDDDGPAASGGMVGAAFWWIGLERGQLKICSHMAGVLPGWQGRGIGRMLKVRQRELVLEQGLTEWITWTYDPLQRVNAVLNIHRLGATCSTYARNVYGTMNDALNAGTPSDRFQVDWWLRSARVEEALAGQQSAWPQVDNTWQILPTTLNQHKLQQPAKVPLHLQGVPLAVPIPDDIAQIRRTDPALGGAWRMYLRAVFEEAFAAGYIVVDCVQLTNQGWFYLLQPPA